MPIRLIDLKNTLNGYDNIKVENNKSSPKDSDHDGVNDALDQCPGTPTGVTVDAVGCPFTSNADLLKVIHILNVSSGNKQPVNEQYHDFTGDGKIGIPDALYLLQKQAGYR